MKEITDLLSKKYSQYYKANFKEIPESEVLELRKNIKILLDDIIKNQGSNDKLQDYIKNFTFSELKISILHVLVKFDSEESFKNIISIFANEDRDWVDIGDINSFTCLHQACIGGRFEMVKLLLSLGADINLSSSITTRKWTPIHFASRSGSKEIVEELIKAGVNKEVKTSFGLTPLHVACEFGRENVVKYLLDLKVNKNEITNDENQNITPLHYAVVGNFDNLVKILLDNHVDINKKNGADCDSLEMASKADNIKMMELLIGYGANNIDNALQEAQENNCDQAVIFLKNFITIRDKLFNSTELKKVSNDLEVKINDYNDSNLSEFKLNLFNSFNFNAYGICAIKKSMGLFKKKDFNLREFAEMKGIKNLSSSLLKLENTVNRATSS